MLHVKQPLWDPHFPLPELPRPRGWHTGNILVWGVLEIGALLTRHQKKSLQDFVWPSFRVVWRRRLATPFDVCIFAVVSKRAKNQVERFIYVYILLRLPLQCHRGWGNA